MSDVRVFVSYSRLSIYRDGGPRAGKNDPWPSVLSKEIKRSLDTKPELDNFEFYVYDDAPAGENWRENIALVAESKFLMPVLSETYFKSGTCFLEWVAFVTKNPNLGVIPNTVHESTGNIFPVFRFETLDEQAGSLTSDVYRECLESLKLSFNDLDQSFSENHMKWARKWVSSLTGTTGGLLSNFKAVSDQYGFEGSIA